MSNSFESMRGAIEESLGKLLPQSGHPQAKPLDQALHYALFPGGKRLRPILTLLGAQVFRSDATAAMPAACAIEFVHTSSLIFDDLPCMDDAGVRRGLPVLHRVYGEEIALLAGLALLNQSFAIFSQSVDLMREATDCIGMKGMIGGQALDLAPQNLPGVDAPQLSAAERSAVLSERNRKTSAMMRLALTAGALACGTPAAEVSALAHAGHRLGEAYQICDDLLDVRHTSMQTGKTAGQDLRHARPSHGHADDQAALGQAQSMIEETRSVLQTAYGNERVAALLGFIDAMFARLVAA